MSIANILAKIKINKKCIYFMTGIWHGFLRLGTCLNYYAFIAKVVIKSEMFFGDLCQFVAENGKEVYF